MSNLPATPTTRRLTLALGGRAFDFAAGQAASLRVPGDGEFTPYSIVSAPYEARRDGAVEFLVKVDGANRFGAHVTDIRPGQDIEVDGPFGRFVLPDGPLPPLVFIAGGTGIAPLRAMIAETLHRRHDEPLALVYSARRPQEFAYLDEFQQLDRDARLSLRLTLTGNAEDWQHARGRASAAHLEDLVTPRTAAFVCGPHAMVVTLTEVLTGLGVDPSRVRVEDW